MHPITLTLNVDKTNQILNALSKLPFGEVSALIGEIQAQANAQLQAKLETEEKKD